VTAHFSIGEDGKIRNAVYKSHESLTPGRVHKIVFGVRKGNKFGLQISLLREISLYRTTNEGIEVRASYSAFIGLNYRQRGPHIGGRPEDP
jgi:hypothetical protein